MASLRLNYEPEKSIGQKRPTNARGMDAAVRKPNVGILINNRVIMPVVEAVETCTDYQADKCISDLEVKPIASGSYPAELPIIDNEQENSKEEAKEPKQNVSAAFIAELDKYEGVLLKIQEQIDYGKGLFDDLLSYVESFMKIMSVVEENQNRKEREPDDAISSSKTNKDNIDEVLDLLQTPVFQGILRQVLVGLLVKK